MKGYNSDYGSSDSNFGESDPVNGIDYNTACSSSVGEVESVNEIHNSHNVPPHGIPNSVTINIKDGHIFSERYYNDSGGGYLDIDYTDHGNRKTHPNVPHEHDIWFDDSDKMHRGEERKIK